MVHSHHRISRVMRVSSIAQTSSMQDSMVSSSTEQTSSTQRISSMQDSTASSSTEQTSSSSESAVCRTVRPAAVWSKPAVRRQARREQQYGANQDTQDSTASSSMQETLQQQDRCKSAVCRSIRSADECTAECIRSDREHVW